MFTYVLDNAYSDYLLGEIVSRSSKDEVQEYLKIHIEGLGLNIDIPNYIEKGLVLSDPLGRGVFQPKNPEIKQERAICRDYPKHKYGINPNAHVSKMLNPFGNATRGVFQK